MKKIISALAAFMLACSVFAVDLSTDLNFALPFDFTKSSSSATLIGQSGTAVTKNKETGYGIDLGAKAMLTDMFGVKVNLGLYFPQKNVANTTVTTKIAGKESTTKMDPVTTNYSDAFDSFTAFNVFVGPAICVQNKKAYDITVTPGLSIDMRKASVKVGDETKSTKYQYWGFGAEVDACYNITKNLYLNFSCPFAYQFKIVDENENEKDRSGFYLVPKFGLGYNF